MLFDLLFLIISLYFILKSADFATHYSTRLAEGLNLPKYIIGFIIVAIISILPETFVSITSALEGIPAFGLGTLFGSNVADLTLLFVIVILFTGRQLKVESKIIKNKFFHFGALLVPIILGWDGQFSRLEGLSLIVVGICFYLLVLKNNSSPIKLSKEKFRPLDILFLLISMGTLLLFSHYAVKSGTALASELNISPILIGMFIVGIGTILPELFFSLKAAQKNHDSLALGDVLGTVVADATIVVGIFALFDPFSFNPQLIYSTALFMLGASILLFHFMKTGKAITKKEAWILLIFYLLFVTTELLLNKIIPN